jgi:hypothetical protein
VLNIVVLVNTLSAAEVAALKFLGEHTLADSGIT